MSMYNYNAILRFAGLNEEKHGATLKTVLAVLVRIGIPYTVEASRYKTSGRGSYWYDDSDLYHYTIKMIDKINHGEKIHKSSKTRDVLYSMRFVLHNMLWNSTRVPQRIEVHCEYKEVKKLEKILVKHAEVYEFDFNAYSPVDLTVRRKVKAEYTYYSHVVRLKGARLTVEGHGKSGRKFKHDFPSVDKATKWAEEHLIPKMF